MAASCAASRGSGTVETDGYPTTTQRQKTGHRLPPAAGSHAHATAARIPAAASRGPVGSVWARLGVVWSSVILGLQFEKLCVLTARCNQLFVRAFFANGSVFEHDDSVGHAHR